MTWMGVVDVATLQKGIIGGNYFPKYIHRDNSFTYNQGSEVCPLDAPDGEVFVMQSYNAHTDQGLAAEQSPATLSGKQTLPEGWRFRVKTLDRDLVVPRDKTGKPAHVMQGHLLNRYQAPTAAKRSATCHKGSARQRLAAAVTVAVNRGPRRRIVLIGPRFRLYGPARPWFGRLPSHRDDRFLTGGIESRYGGPVLAISRMFRTMLQAATDSPPAKGSPAQREDFRP